MSRVNLLILDGPSLNLLGKREPEIYGNQSMDDFLPALRAAYPQVNIEYFQSNSEGALIDKLHEAASMDGIILNAGAYTHTSVALYDAVRAISAPVVEVHISNIYARESFRHTSMIAAACRGVIAGFGLQSYRLAVEILQVR
ncbi:MAG: type II 3-dehydroquinate dehydratase [Prevotellaceae bacterium]|jgi:3-dehydroquinate dehydratase-2|nr:type II 3-dehydroquinate dehydratase [Prevotellaceae bacterium]